MNFLSRQPIANLSPAKFCEACCQAELAELLLNKYHSSTYCCYRGTVLLGDQFGAADPGSTCYRLCFTMYCGVLSDGNQESFWLSDFLTPLPSGAHKCACAFFTSILSSDRSLFCTRLWFYFCSYYYRGFLATSCFFSAFMRIWPFFIIIISFQW